MRSEPSENINLTSYLDLNEHFLPGELSIVLFIRFGTLCLMIICIFFIDLFVNNKKRTSQSS